MTVIGNDNYRPGLAPPKAVRANGGWLSSNMAQLMVFLNGLILTIVAFATLNIFIEEIVRDGMNATTVEVQERIIQNYEGAQDSINALAYMAGAIDDTSNLVSYVEKTGDKAKYFEAIYIVDYDAAGNQDALAILESDEFKKRREESSIDFKAALLAETIKNANKISVSMLHSLALDTALSEINDGSITSKHYILTKRIQRAVLNENERDVSVTTAPRLLVAIGYHQGLLPFEWVEKKEAIDGVTILQPDTKASLYNYQRQQNEEAALNGAQIPTTTMINTGDFKTELQVTMKIGIKEAFLRKIPLLMLLFGITLTLIGTMYVRNNQRQSLKLSDMNKELAHKNYELSQQMNERERLNMVIQKSARDNKAVINAVSDIIFEISTDETLVFLNDTWMSVTGFDVEQSIGRNLFDLFYYQDQEEQKKNFAQLVKGAKRPYRAYTRLRTSDGTFRAVELTMSMIRQDENKDLRVVGTITDVEERRRAERALSEAEKKYRAIVENAAAGIYQVTPEGQFLSGNPAMAKIWGFEHPEEILRDVINVNRQLYVNPTEREDVLRQIIETKSPMYAEFEIRKKDESVIWAAENIRPVYDDEGNLIYFEGSIEDIDQRKKAEIALKEAKIESDLANRSKSEFLTNMSHELRTPLNSIIGFSDIIKSQAFGEIAQSEYVEYAQNINESGNGLLKIINEILDVSRIDAGERALNETHINVSELVSSTLMLLNAKFETANMEIHNRVINPELAIIGEAQAIKQIMINLLSNAMKFNKDNGVITLDSEVDVKGRFRLSITDTGVGLTEDEIKKALSPFGQINSELSRDQSGTGLGLTLVKSLMRLHGGKLDLVSQKGVGTTATLVFPESRVARKKRVSAEATSSVTAPIAPPVATPPEETV